MRMTDAFVQELEQEGQTTRRVLERVPTDKLSWKPHAKSMSLGELAMHVAASPAFTSSWALDDVTQFTGESHSVVPSSTKEILAAHDDSMKKTKDTIQMLGDAGLQKPWSAKAGDRTLYTMPKIALVRSIVLNHWIHHRGQLSVYLRLLNVPVPSIYGPSADENPFAARV